MRDFHALSKTNNPVFLGNRGGTASAKLKLTMKNPLAHRGSGAFTLVELLTVIAILGILAALLLPVLSKAQGPGQTDQCENNLEQLGVAYHLFATDHGGKFQMPVSTDEGGALEFVIDGYRMRTGIFLPIIFSSPLSDELGTPNLRFARPIRAAAGDQFQSACAMKSKLLPRRGRGLQSSQSPFCWATAI